MTFNHTDDCTLLFGTVIVCILFMNIGDYCMLFNLGCFSY